MVQSAEEEKMKSPREIMKKAASAFIKILGLASFASTLAACPCAYGPAPIDQETDQTIENQAGNTTEPAQDIEIR